MYGNQIHPLHVNWNRSEGWILDRVSPGDGGQNTSVSIVRGETGRGIIPIPFHVCVCVYVFGEIQSPSAKSTFNGNENSLNYALRRNLWAARNASNEGGGCDFISWRVMCEEGWPKFSFYASAPTHHTVRLLSPSTWDCPLSQLFFSFCSFWFILFFSLIFIFQATLLVEGR